MSDIKATPAMVDAALESLDHEDVWRAEMEPALNAALAASGWSFVAVDDAMCANACMTHSHDFGLLSEATRNSRMDIMRQVLSHALADRIALPRQRGVVTDSDGNAYEMSCMWVDDGLKFRVNGEEYVAARGMADAVDKLAAESTARAEKAERELAEVESAWRDASNHSSDGNSGTPSMLRSRIDILIARSEKAESEAVYLSGRNSAYLNDARELREQCRKLRLQLAECYAAAGDGAPGAHGDALTAINALKLDRDMLRLAIAQRSPMAPTFERDPNDVDRVQIDGDWFVREGSTSDGAELLEVERICKGAGYCDEYRSVVEDVRKMAADCGHWKRVAAKLSKENIAARSGAGDVTRRMLDALLCGLSANGHLDPAVLAAVDAAMEVGRG